MGSESLEQVRQDESQVEQVDSVFLAYPEGQSAQVPIAGWFALIWVAEQVRQSDEVAPEQVAQEESQLVQAETEDLNWLEAQAEQAPAEGWLARIFAESEQLKHSFAAGPEQLEQSPWQGWQVLSLDLQ